MSDDPNQRGAADRDRVSGSELYEIKHFADSMKKRHPKASSEDIAKAIQLARQRLGGSEDREKMTLEVDGILG